MYCTGGGLPPSPDNGTSSLGREVNISGVFESVEELWEGE